MFEFTDLDGMSRVWMLHKQKDAVLYWRQVHRLKGAFVLWQTQTIALVRRYKATGGASDLTQAVDAVAVKGELTLRKLDNLEQRLNKYLADMDARLGDGTKWYNAIEIQALYEESENEEK